ncbi:MAG: T9SS type A sorting domain-containing protein [Bacteroidia bacterium]|nr:T9SS type A sorting domain-containing protein [Bacteroidia bacterium]
MKKHNLLFFFLLTAFFAAAQNPISVNVTVTQVPCHNDGKMHLNIFGGTPPYSITWMRNWQYINNTTDSLVNAHPGLYIISVTDAAQNFGSSTFILPGSFNLTASFVNANCPALDGAVYLQASGGIAPYTFQWNTGTTTIDTAGIDSLVAIPAGYYYAVVSDSTGCIINSTDMGNGFVDNIAPIQYVFQIKEDSCNDGTIKVIASGSAPPFTYSWQSGISSAADSAYGLDVGGYSVTIIDSNNCSMTVYPYVHPDSLHLQSTANSSNAVCPGFNNGSLTVSPFSGVPPYSLVWSTGDTLTSISNLSPASYSVTITDSRGCYIKSYHYVDGVSNTIVSIDSLKQPDCSNSNGSIWASGSGIGPVHFSWNNGDTSANASNLTTGNYAVTVTDSVGCSTISSSISLILPDSCYAHINGTVYNDMDSSCSFNTGESGIPNRIIQLSNGDFISTAFFGEYHYKTHVFGATNVTTTPPTGWDLVCPPSSYSVVTAPNSLATGLDFYEHAQVSSDDLIATCFIGLPRPGFTHRSYFAIKNNGTTTQAASIQFKHDTIEQYIGAANGISYNSLTRTLSGNLVVLPPDAYYVYWADFTIPATTPLNTPLTASVLVLPNSNDATPLDNVDTCHTFVVGSYDPNDKTVEPRYKNGSEWIYHEDSVLTYTIRFQNTGNYPTTFITLVDTLDADLNIPSFEFLSASHAGCSWSINGPGVITFKFDSIQLEGATINEPASHGFVKYRIKTKKDPAPYTEFTNTASIYFDYNAPIVTNTVKSVEYPYTLAGVESITQNKSAIKLWPNPSTDQFNLAFENANATRKITVNDLQGRCIFTGPANNIVNAIDCSAFETGAYVICVFENNKKIAAEKLFIVR